MKTKTEKSALSFTNSLNLKPHINVFFPGTSPHKSNAQFIQWELFYLVLEVIHVCVIIHLNIIAIVLDLFL